MSAYKLNYEWLLNPNKCLITEKSMKLEWVLIKPNMKDYWIRMSAYKTKEIPESKYLILREIIIIEPNNEWLLNQNECL